jgi:hypothetical protein
MGVAGVVERIGATKDSIRPIKRKRKKPPKDGKGAHAA